MKKFELSSFNLLKDRQPAHQQVNGPDDYLLVHPQPFQRDRYLGKYADTHPENTEPYAGEHTQVKTT